MRRLQLCGVLSRASAAAVGLPSFSRTRSSVSFQRRAVYADLTPAGRIHVASEPAAASLRAKDRQPG
jgi:hypothetical protein